MPSWPLAATAFTLSCAAFSSLRELRVQGERRLRQLRRGRRICLRDLKNVDPVERRQLIEVHDVIVKGVRNQNQIADVLRIRGNGQLERVFDGAHARHRVHGRAYAAEALREHPCVARIAAAQNRFNAAPHGA